MRRVARRARLKVQALGLWPTHMASLKCRHRLFLTKRRSDAIAGRNFIYCDRRSRHHCCSTCAPTFRTSPVSGPVPSAFRAASRGSAYWRRSSLQARVSTCRGSPVDVGDRANDARAAMSACRLWPAAQPAGPAPLTVGGVSRWRRRRLVIWKLSRSRRLTASLSSRRHRLLGASALLRRRTPLIGRLMQAFSCRACPQLSQ